MAASPSWSLKDRSFLIAVSASLLWHFFWFFLIHVNVIPSRNPLKTRPRVVALGPVLDDAIFKTLVETKPQFSETFYRHLSDFSQSIEPPIRTIKHHAPGEVVSLPLGKKIGNALRHWLGGEKFTPAYELTKHLDSHAPSTDQKGQ